MRLVIDIGNSNVVIGVGNDLDWRHVWRLPTLTDHPDGLLFYEVQISNLLLENDLRPGTIHQAVISSVVPDLMDLFVQLVHHLFRIDPLLVGPGLYPLLSLRIDRPNEIGTDLLANAVAAHHLYRQDCIIVDFGTALTFTSLTGAGHILGVAIAPGLKTAISALYNKTAQLPEVPLELPSSAVGKNTVHAIQSGVLIGYVGLVKHMLSSLRDELGEQYIAVATGGLSSILHPLQDEFKAIDPYLTLNGLSMIGKFVAEKKGS